MATDAQELASWIRLEQTPGVGPETARRLLSAFGLPENIFNTAHSALSEVVPERIARALLAPASEQTTTLIEKTLAWAGEPDNRILTLADPDYPPALLEIADPPLILYAKGRTELLATRAIAIVGSRNATVQGTNNAAQFADHLSRGGVTIISGLALGIDAAAHRGALQETTSACGSTVAVIGTGADIVYPARNRDLAHRIAEHGCIVSEYPLSTPAIAANFPRRNRIISGLARGVLVVEAAAQSGSLITARMALEQGRDVFAIPGSIHSPLSKGCHLLIKQGAKLVESANDILEELGPMPCSAHAAASSSANEQAAVKHELLDIMGFDPIDIDILAQHARMDIGAMNAQLLTLELAGEIEMLPGGTCRRLVGPRA
ncbi:MAG: DNA-processing protein DprA [Burkholderiaceae bacterium]